MAEVFQVRDVTDGSRHALKVLTHPDEQHRKRMLKEGELIAAIDSPHVVQMRGELRIDGRPGLLMELVRGPTLHQYLRHAEPTVGQALTLFRGVAMGVGAAHAKGVVHRDLKPANVLLHVEGDAVVPKVVDFGVAKDLVQGQGLTVRGTAYGTPHFMAPEQLDDSSTVARRADMWSLGVILYRLVCGRLPFAANKDLLLNVMLGRYDAPKTVRSTLSPEVVFAISELLQTKVEKRIPDVPSLFGVLEGRTALNGDDELGSLAVRAGLPTTNKPTALPVRSLPTELLAALEEQSTWEQKADEQAPVSTFTPAPAPPKWAAGESMHPRTMDPNELGPLKRGIATPTPAPAPAVQPVSSENDAAAEGSTFPVALVLGLGAFVAGFVGLAVVVAVGLWWALR